MWLHLTFLSFEILLSTLIKTCPDTLYFYFIFWVVTVACRFWLTWRGILPGWFCCHRKYHRTEKYGQLALCLHFSSSEIRIRFYLTQRFSVSHATFDFDLSNLRSEQLLPFYKTLNFGAKNQWNISFRKLAIFGAKIQIFELFVIQRQEVRTSDSPTQRRKSVIKAKCLWNALSILTETHKLKTPALRYTLIFSSGAESEAKRVIRKQA